MEHNKTALGVLKRTSLFSGISAMALDGDLIWRWMVILTFVIALSMLDMRDAFDTKVPLGHGLTLSLPDHQ